MRSAHYGRSARGWRSPRARRFIDALEQRLLLHGGVDHDDGSDDEALPAWHALEHELAAMGTDVAVPPSPALSAATLDAQTAAAVAAGTGQWGNVLQWPGVAVHAAMMPSGKVLFWDYDAHTQLWDPVTNVLTNVSDPAFNAFCSGHAFLADGRLLVAGGHIANGVGLPNAAIYDSVTDTWTNVPNMNAGRWYPSATTLGNGDIAVAGGTISSYTDPNTMPQVWQADGSGWRDLTTAIKSVGYYPDTFLTASGDIFYAGVRATTSTLDVGGTGIYSDGPQRLGGNRDYGSAVMYDDGKILSVGGGDPPKATAEVIDLNSQNPSWRAVDSMDSARRQMNATILADGEVLVTGGVSGPGFNDRATPVYTAEMWNPTTEQFTPMATMTQPRWYHSTALLLPDGRVLTAGGDDTPTAEVYSPPYLFNGPRPTITAGPDVVTWGRSFDVETPDADQITGANLIRMGSVTHAFNFDQRIEHLSFTKTANGLKLTAPEQPNLAPPGYYMLFLVNASGVPSVAKVMRVGIASGATRAPFSGAPILVPGGFEAEDYDKGGDWLSFHDSTPGNAGDSSHRDAGDDVDVYTMVGASGGNAVGDLRAGEWLDFSVTLASAGKYNLTARIATAAGEGGTFHVEVGGVDKTGPRTVGPVSGWQDVTAPITLAAGTSILRVKVDSTAANGLGRFDRFDLAPVPDGAPTIASPATATAPAAANVPVSLDVLGADDAGEANLTYTWAVITKPDGAADPVFSPAAVNGTNAAKHLQATFAAVGTYNLRATVTDAVGQSVTSEVTVQVAQTVRATLRATDDATVRGGTYANTNAGQDTALGVKRFDADYTREAYLKFDLTAFDGSGITQAILRMDGRASETNAVVPIALYGSANKAWSESTITWNNKPATDTPVLATASVLGTATDIYYEFDVTAYLQSMQAAGATAVTFAIKATADTSAAIIFKSDEYAGNKPQLVVDHGGAPPPPPPPPVPALVVSPAQLGVPEGGSSKFTVKLASQPSTDVLVAVARQTAGGGGDVDLSTPLDAPLTFTPENWNTPQDVLVFAANDADALNGSATFTISAAGTASKSVLVSEIDAQIPPTETLTLRALADGYVRDGTYATTNFGTAPELIAKKGPASYARESYLRFDLSAVGNPQSAVLRLYGGLNGTGTGVAFTIYAVSNTTWSETSLNWNNKPAAGTALGSATATSPTKQWFTFDVTSYLAAQRAAGATAVAFAIKATNTTDPYVTFASDDASANRPELVVQHVPKQSLVVSATSLSVPEGSSRTFTIRLTRKPAADVTVDVSRQSGDGDLSATPGSLTFTTANWDQPQTVTVSAAQDTDTTNGSSVFAVSSAGLDGKTLTVTEADDDVAVGPVTLRAVADTYVRDGTLANANYGNDTELHAKSKGAGYNRETWMRFDLTALASAASAKLRLWGWLGEAMAGGVQVGVNSSSNQAWGETSLTWNNRPTSSESTKSVATVTVSGTAAKWYEIDLTAFVKTELAAGRKVISLVLRATTQANAYVAFASDEAAAAANRPQLLVTP